MDLRSITRSALNALFGLGPDLVKDATYVRPASLAPATGVSTATETTAAVKIVTLNYHPREFSLVGIQPHDEKVLIRASELAPINSPAEGDYLIQTSDSQRREILSGLLDRTGEFWTFQTTRSLNQDWGDLTTFTTSEDWGDLTAITESDDWGPLFA